MQLMRHGKAKLSPMAVCVFPMVALAACNPQNIAQASNPPPPPTVYEIWNPVDREHSVSARCAGNTALIDWSYRSGTAEINAVRFGSSSLSEATLEAIRSEVKTLGGDFHTYLECSQSIAIFLFIESNVRGEGPPKKVQFTIGTEGVLQLQKFNF